jgi:hypothetical protein
MSTMAQEGRQQKVRGDEIGLDWGDDDKRVYLTPPINAPFE